MFDTTTAPTQPAATSNAGSSGGARSPRWSSRIAWAVRWLHIYLSMFGLAALLFFSVTGITLNHPEWFPAAARSEANGKLPAEWLRGDSGVNDEAGVRKLEIVERLRAEHGLRGVMTEFRVDDAECFVAFKGPGYAADAFIERKDGEYSLAVSQAGLIAILNDLHKGRDSGPAWAWVIDLSAGLMTLAALTGLILLFYIKRRRVPGLVVALLGTVAMMAAARWLAH